QVSAVRFLGNEIVKKYPVVTTWMADSPARIDIDSITVASGTYRPAQYLRLNSAYPIVEGYKDYAAFGYHANFSDLLGISGMGLTASYTPNQSLPEDERFHFAAEYRYGFYQLLATYNYANFYDLFGPTKQSLKGYSLEMNYRRNLLWDHPRLMDVRFNLSGYGGLERLPDEQNVAATYDKAYSFSAELSYEDVRKSLGWVDEEKGFRGRLIAKNFYVNGQLFPRVYTALHQGFQLPLHHSSIWLRASAGYSLGDRDNPFANFFFGGFGNNWVDYDTEKRYREFYSFPGMEINAFGGTNYLKAMMEWNLPPLRFRSVGFTSLYLRWARPALFASAIQANLDGEDANRPLPQYGARRTLINAGAQLDFRIVMFSRFDSMFSLGYAVALEKEAWHNEFMISLKLQ
ncbi:hypothetical protein JXO59_15100, partial [candidate division KSB1 bacterium]|nr:hypothetical protein [candidate division KSB1 bacterium]